LIGALSDSAAGVRKQAAWALGAIGDGRAVNALTKSLKDTDAGVRKQAAWALGAIGG
jgi:HEAT repeat protein